jgi:hypothetical protein
VHRFLFRRRTFNITGGPDVWLHTPEAASGLAARAATSLASPTLRCPLRAAHALTSPSGLPPLASSVSAAWGGISPPRQQSGWQGSHLRLGDR